MNDELDRIRQFGVDEPPASQFVTDSARQDLVAAIDAARRDPGARARPSEPARVVRRPRRRRRLRILAMVASAAAIALAAVLAFGSGSGAPTSALAATLHHLADVASQQSPVDAPGPGQYLYVDSVSANDSDAYGNGLTCTALVPQERQIWIATDGSGRLRETDGQPTYTSAHDQAVCEEMHAMAPPGTSDDWYARGCLTIGLASRLPDGNFEDPATLLGEMRTIDGGPPGPGEDFVHVGDFLRESDASPALRAAIYRAAATIPGVKLLGPTRDHLGRSGVGIGFEGHDTISELILDPNTSALLAEQTVHASTGRVLTWTAYRASKIVDGIPGNPPAPLDPPCVNGGGYEHDSDNGPGVVTGAPLTK